MPPKLSSTPSSIRTRSRVLEEEPNQPNPTSPAEEIEEESPPPRVPVDH